MSIRGRQPRLSGRLPRRGPGDTALLLWRGKWLMLAMFLAAFLAGAAAVLSVPQPVEARIRLSVSAEGPVNLPLEMDLFRSAPVRERTAGRFPVMRLFPELEKICQAKLAQTPSAEARQALEQACRREAASQLAYHLSLRPETASTFSAWFRHPDAGTAVEVLNALTGAYLSYREEQADRPAENPVREKRRELEATLARNEADLAALVAESGSYNPETEIRNTEELLTAAKAELVRNRSRAVQARAEVEEYRNRLAGLEPEQFAFIEDTSARTLMQLRAEREEAVATHGPEAPELVELDQRIEQAEAYLKSRGGMVGTARREPNPLYQQAQIALARAEAEAGALEAQRRDLQSRIPELEQRIAALSGILPAYRDLLLEKRIADQALVDLAGEEIRFDTVSEAGVRKVPDVTVLQPAEIVPAGRGDRGLRLLVCAGLAALLALLVGLLRALMTTGFATPGMIERTLRLPVLAVVRRMR